VGATVAAADYAKVEAEAAGGASIEPVLVAAGPIDKIRVAYPNFFLDIAIFAKTVGDIIGTAHKGR
jgi:hypothetical protein